MNAVPVIARIFRAALFEDWALKFVCLLLAVLIWFYIDGELTDQRDIAVLLPLNLKQGWELSRNQAPPKYVVRVRGPRQKLQLAGPDSVHFERPVVPDPHQGANAITLTRSDLSAEGLEIVDVKPNDPKDAFVELVATSQQLKDVRVRPGGEPRKDYVAGKAVSQPTRVMVEGVSEELDSISYVWTDEVDISDSAETVAKDVGISKLMTTPNGRDISLRCNERVRVTIPIRPVELTQAATLDVLTLPSSGTAMLVEPRSVKVEVTGEPKDITENLSKVALYVEWPADWPRSEEIAKSKNSKQIFSREVPVRVFVSGRLQVRGPDGGALPVVTIKGGLAGNLKE